MYSDSEISYGWEDEKEEEVDQLLACKSVWEDSQIMFAYLKDVLTWSEAGFANNEC